MELDLLKKLLEVANELDIALCTLSNRGECNLTGERYEELVDIIFEVEKYLDESDSK